MFLILPRIQDFTFLANCLLEIVYLKCHILFSGKNVTNLLSAELAKRVVRLKKNVVTLLYVCSPILFLSRNKKTIDTFWLKKSTLSRVMPSL